MKQHRILIDGAIFYLQREKPAGISRVWSALLHELAASPLADRLLLLDRCQTAPHTDGLAVRDGRAYAFEQPDEPQYLAQICAEAGISLLISTYYTHAAQIPTLIMLHDMIPEALGWDLRDPQWVTKQHAIQNAVAYLSVSHSTTADFQRLYPEQAHKPLYYTPNAASSLFAPRSPDDVSAFCSRHEITRPYYLFCGHRWPNKNALLFLNGFALLPDKHDYAIVLTGGNDRLEPEFAPFIHGIDYTLCRLDDRELAVAYSGAAALVYPSLYEGFGMPVLEAMQCGCPVITCRNSAIAEVAGDAALYVGEHDVTGMRDALHEIRSPALRKELSARGLTTARSYSWERTGKEIVSALQELCGRLPEAPPPAPQTDASGILVSAVVSTCNASRFITGCLDDLLAQTIADRLEIIIIDSASQEHEAELVKPYLARHANIRYIRTPLRESLYAAWNRGIRAARGTYITNANTDDRHRSDALEVLVNALEAHPQAELAYGNCYISTVANETYSQNDKRRLMRYPDFFAPAALLHYQFGPQPLWRKSLHGKIGFFDESYKAAGDYEFNLRFCLQAAAVHVNEPLGLYLEHPGAISFQDSAMATENRRLQQRWHTPGNVEALYRAAGADCATPAARARALVDMGLRALEYYPPWREGGAEENYELACMCFDAAVPLSPSWTAPYQNIALILKRRGLQHELQDLKNALAAKGLLLPETGEIPPAPSGLTLPSQHELAVPEIETGPAEGAPEQTGRILISCDFFWPSVGGTELFVEELGVRLLQDGFSVDIACRKLAGRTAAEHRGMRIHAFNCEGNLLMGLCGTDFEAYSRLICSRRYGAVIVFAHPDNWNVVAAAECPAPRPRMICMPSINARNMTDWEQAGLLDNIAGILQRADRVVAVTENGCDARFLRRRGIAHSFIPHAVAPCATEQNFREKHGFEHGRPLLAVVANFWPVKNQLALLEVMTRADGDWQIALIGHPVPYPAEQEYYQKVKRLAATDSRVRILECLSPAEADAAIRDADVLLLPSQGESAGPLVILQAMSHGTPWIATPACNAVADEAGGLVAQLEAFPETVHTLLGSREKAAALGALGRRHWQERFCWDRTVAAYRAVIQGNGRPDDLRMPAELREENRKLQQALRGSRRPDSDAAPELSVIIPTFNRCDMLRQCLDALAAQTLAPQQFEVIVCDDGSTDGTADCVNNFAASFSLIHIRQENLGPAAARNRGIAKARSELVMFLNDDAILDPDALAIHIETHRRNAGRKISVLGTFTLHPAYNDLTRPLGYLLEHADLIFDYPFMEADRLYDYIYFYTCNISLPRSAVIACGGFDDDFVRVGAEDIDIGYRLQQLGYLTLYRPDCIARHAHRLDLRGLRNMFAFRGKGGVLLFLRHEELFTHYRFVSPEIVQRWIRKEAERDTLRAELEQKIAQVHALPIEPRTPLPEKTFRESERLSFFKSIWNLAPDDLLAILRRLNKDMRDLSARIADEPRAWSLPQVAEALYPAVNFLKWYYDTLGVMQSPWIHDFIAATAERQRKNASRSIYYKGTCGNPFRDTFRRKLREGNESWLDMIRGADALFQQATSARPPEPALLSEATAGLTKALALRPYDPDRQALLQAVFASRNDSTMAQQAAEKIDFLFTEIGGSDIAGRQRQTAFAHLHTNNRTGAMLHFNELLHIRPEAQEAALELMSHCMQHGIFNEAHNLIQKITACYNGNNPFAYIVYYRMAQLAFMQGEHARTAELCRKSLSSTLSAPALNLLAEISLRRGNIDEAVSCWKRSLQADGLQIPLYLKLYEAAGSAAAPHASGTAAAVIRCHDVRQTMQQISRLCETDINLTTIFISEAADSIVGPDTFPEQIAGVPVHCIGARPANDPPALFAWLQALQSRHTSEFIAFINDNVTLPHNWFSRLSTSLERYSRAAAAGAKVVMSGSAPCRMHSAYRFIDAISDTEVRLTTTHRNEPDVGQFDFVRTCAAVPESCLVYRSAALRDICSKYNAAPALCLTDVDLGALPTFFDCAVVYSGLTEARYDIGREREVTPLNILYPEADVVSLHPSAHYRPQNMLHIQARSEERDREDIRTKISALRDMGILAGNHTLPLSVI